MTYRFIKEFIAGLSDFRNSVIESSRTASFCSAIEMLGVLIP